MKLGKIKKSGQKAGLVTLTSNTDIWEAKAWGLPVSSSLAWATEWVRLSQKEIELEQWSEANEVQGTVTNPMFSIFTNSQQLEEPTPNQVSWNAIADRI